MINFFWSLADDNDKEKIAHLYCTHIDGMIKYARTLLRDDNDKNFEHDGLDAVHNAFAKIIKYKKIDFSRTPGEITHYLRTAVHNEVRNILKDIKNVESFDEEYGTTNMTDEEFFERLCLRERCDIVKRAIEIIDEKYADILMLKMKHTPEEISKMLGLPVKTVYTRIYRAQRLLLEKADSLEKEVAVNG